MSEFDDDAPTFEAGKWYLFTAPDFFTMVGQYVKPLGFGLHRFRHVVHLINGGGRLLPELCVLGPAEGNNAKITPPFPGDWNGAVKWSTGYFGPTHWVKEKRR